MDWILFWTAFGAIGGTIGAFATAAAVIVALWQTKFSQKKKLKLSVSLDSTVITPGTNELIRYVCLNITNIGNRDVVIKSWGFKINKENNMLVVPPLDPITKMVCKELPHKVNLEESFDLAFLKKQFITAVTEEINKETLKGNKKIEFYAVDSSGNIYTCKTDKTASEILSQNK